MPAITDQNWDDYVDEEDLFSMRKYGESIDFSTGESIFLPRGDAIYLARENQGGASELVDGKGLGGFIPFLVPLGAFLLKALGGLAAASTVAAGVATPILKAQENAEKARHNREMEAAARGNGFADIMLNSPVFQAALKQSIPEIKRFVNANSSTLRGAGINPEGGDLPPYLLMLGLKALDQAKAKGLDSLLPLMPILGQEIMKAVKRVNSSDASPEVKGGVLPFLLPGLLYYHLKKNEVDANQDNNPFGILGKVFSQIAHAKKGGETGHGLMDVITSGISKAANFISQNKDTISNVSDVIGKVVGTASNIAKEVEEVRRIRALRGNGLADTILNAPVFQAAYKQSIPEITRFVRGNGLSPYPTYTEADFGKKSSQPTISKHDEAVANYIISGSGIQIFD